MFRVDGDSDCLLHAVRHVCDTLGEPDELRRRIQETLIQVAPSNLYYEVYYEVRTTPPKPAARAAPAQLCVGTIDRKRSNPL